MKEVNNLNADIRNYRLKYGVLEYEIAEMLEMDLFEFRKWLADSELTQREKYEVKKAIRRIREIEYRDKVEETHPGAYMTKPETKYVKAFSAHCCLSDRPKYTGQNRGGYDYYEGCYDWE